MQKLEKDLYIKHAKRLNVILDEQSTFITFINRVDFKQVIQNELNVLAACEKLFPKVDIESSLTAKALLKKYNNVAKEKFKLDEKFKYEDETDLIDSINYLATFCSNMFKVNLDDLVSGKKVTATDPKIDLRSKAQFDDDSRLNSNFAFAGAGIPLATTPYENPYLMGKAYAKLQDDMQAGKFYKYKTKPRIIPIAKWCSIIITLLIALSFGILSVFSFMGNSIMDGVFDLFVVAFGIYSATMILKTVTGKQKNNDNMKYFFPWQFIMVSMILFVIFALTDTVLYWCNTTLPEDPAQSLIIAFNGLKITSVVICGLIVVGLIPLVIAAIYNPKPDTEKIEGKIREYIDLFVTESGQQMPVPPKVDVKKPVNVEETKTTKSKKKDTKEDKTSK